MLQWELSAILSSFIKLPFVIKTVVLYSFEWPCYTGFTVLLFLYIFGKMILVGMKIIADILRVTTKTGLFLG